MSDDDDRGFRQLVLHAQQEVDQARAQFHDDRAAGGVSRETRRHLHRAVMRYHGILRRFRDEPHLDDEQRELFGELDEVAVASETVEVESAGDVAGAQPEQRPFILQPRRAVTLSHELDDIANALGFAPDTGRHEVREKFSLDDLEVDLSEDWRDDSSAEEADDAA